ncbi:MAG: MBL fold metallo-hydrolase [Lentisphaeria bacterium]|nr:MBL fold metallo-hydrolase [Lentisphaeria bacterium]
MQIKLGFHGATGNVTGSRYCLKANGKNIVIDCGLFQEHDLKARNWDDFSIHPSKIDAIVLTHAHLDHCGLLPKMVREGFRGKIYCNSATAEIAKIVLLDSARINQEDADFKRRRHERENRQPKYPDIPLYTEEDALATFPLFFVWNQKRPLNIGEGIELEFIEVAHILGASSIRITVTQGEEKRSIVFSGDIGRWDMPILRDPSAIGQADYVVTESTYGDREHGPQKDIASDLARIVMQTREAGGNLLIPSFAIERTQELVFFLSQLLYEDRIPHLRIFVDSPMAIKVGKVFKHHPHLFDDEARKLMRNYRASNITLTRSVADSKSINHIRGTAIIIAGSGMCTGGRIKHHLVTNIERPESTVLFVGYQAQNTLGRLIVDGKEEVRILGEMYQVKARVEKLSGFSAHADKIELMRWLDSISNTPRRVFVTHGEPKAAKAHAENIRSQKGWQVEIPQYHQEYILD